MPEQYTLVIVECRKCGHKVYKPVDAVPIGSHHRWRCNKCGHRGASLTRTWSWNKPDFTG
jgi:hypothetical protein